MRFRVRVEPLSTVVKTAPLNIFTPATRLPPLARLIFTALLPSFAHPPKPISHPLQPSWIVCIILGVDSFF
jgi:hypothetical protein